MVRSLYQMMSLGGDSRISGGQPVEGPGLIIVRGPCQSSFLDALISPQFRDIEICSTFYMPTC
jgi:hypothetical protein